LLRVTWLIKLNSHVLNVTQVPLLSTHPLEAMQQVASTLVHQQFEWQEALVYDEYQVSSMPACCLATLLVLVLVLVLFVVSKTISIHACKDKDLSSSQNRNLKSGNISAPHFQHLQFTQHAMCLVFDPGGLAFIRVSYNDSCRCKLKT
jgi:hypothetical protein